MELLTSQKRSYLAFNRPIKKITASIIPKPSITYSRLLCSKAGYSKSKPVIPNVNNSAAKKAIDRSLGLIFI